jgi:hypothetical protein
MVKLGWGPNAIIEVSVALVLELMSPIRLVILGRVQVALPDKKSTILNLRLDVVGVVDFDKGEISVDASLVDSRLVVFVITGDMAVRIGWGATKIFAIAAGGFHPNFLPPPGFPSLRRLAISLGDGDNPRLRLECYMALTANTIQFGAALDAYLRMDTFVGTIAISAFVHFDALIQFQPLEMTAALGAQIEITRDGAPFLLAALSATLTGPTPWHVVGYAEFNFLGKHRVDVEITSGPVAPAPIVTMNPGDVLGEIAKAFARPDAWVALPPGDAERIVSIRDQAPGGPGVVVHPLGALSTRQRVLPLGTAIDRFGAAVVPATTFRLDGFRVGSGATEPPEAELYDDFSPGQFKVLNDDERVARPVFESMRSGGRVKISSFRLPDDVPQGLPTTSAYDEWTVDVEPETGARVDKARSGAGATLPTHVTDALVATGAAAQAETRQTGAPQFRGPTLAVTIRPERYLLAEVDSCEPVWGARAISSAEAHDLLAVRGGAGMPVQVVPASEAAA